jgi:hypothetical protein
MLARIRAWWSTRKADAVVHRWCYALAQAIRKGDLDDTVRALSPLLDHKRKVIEVSWGNQTIYFARIHRVLRSGYFYTTEINNVELPDKADEVIKEALEEREDVLYQQQKAEENQEKREKQRKLAEKLARLS